MKKLSFMVGLMVSSTALAAEPPNEPKYDCTVEETKMYIEQVTHNVFAPSPIPSPDEFKKAYVETAQEKAAAGDEDSQMCATIFTDGRLQEGWKQLVDNLRSLDFELSFSSMDAAMLEQLLARAKEKVTEEVTSALEQLGEDICAFMSTDNLEGMLLDTVNQKYGLRAKSLELDEFSDAVTEQMLLNADRNVQLLLSEDELIDEISSETRNELRRQRRDLWRNF